MENFWAILTGAPWWVYVLFIYLVIIGIKSTKRSAVSIKRVVLLPLVFVVWSLYNLCKKLALGYLSLLPLWIICLMLGAYLGVKEVQGWAISKDRSRGQITLPGNYSTLVLIVLVFALKFFWGYFYATHTPVPYGIYFWDTLTSSLVTGFFVGRAGFFYKSYQG